MNPFRTERDAKEMLIDQIVAEAERVDVPLSELEVKMLYFTETGGTLPDMIEVNAAFERAYDNDAYEEKIAGLVRSMYARGDRSEQEIEAWNDAVVRLSGGDHYLNLLIDGASPSITQFPSSLGRLGKWLPTFDGPGKREPGDRMRLILVGLGFAAVLMIGIVVASLFR
jgi:hypothetical protein